MAHKKVEHESRSSFTHDCIRWNVDSRGIDRKSDSGRNHDSVNNVNIAADLVKGTEMRFIKGVEVSATENGHILHILGYNIDPENASLNEVLLKNRNVMEERDENSIMILRDLNYPVCLQEFLAYENNPERGGWKALNYIKDKGLCKTYKDFFRLFGDKRSSINIEGCARPKTVISAIKEAGGIPVLAHPGSGLYRYNPQDTVSFALEQGVEGIECFHPENNDETTNFCLELCKNKNLYITGGSDCHGTFVKERCLGNPDIDLDQLALWEF